MSEQQKIGLVKLGDTDLTLGNPDQDIRGRTVLDRSGDEVGEVEDLVIGRDDARVFFLQVASGGFLGIGEKRFMIPVDAITGIDEDRVHVDRSREDVAGGPEYDPSLVREDDDFWMRTYSYYGYGPSWAPGYTYPSFPYFGTGGPGRTDAPASPETPASRRRTGI